MEQPYADIRHEARLIAARYPAPAFYTDCADLVARSRRHLATSPVCSRLLDYVDAHVDNDLGHGMDHVTRVTIDAGALVLAEARRLGLDPDFAGRRLFLVQCAGILHDICRKEKNHAEQGAKAAAEILAPCPLSSDEVGDICQAIRNHEAFKTPDPVNTPAGALLSDCLYDADKFRWGPDNFTDTVWHMVSFFRAPLSVFLDRYPEGIQGIVRIKSTFRSHFGRIYGPGFIDLGLSMGEQIHEMIVTRFAPHYP